MKLYRIITWVIALTLAVCASTQTDAKRAFRLYMHDGSVHFFFYSDIQSMTVGYEDGDMDCPVQIINTPDSVYTFPMADIDSVSFARPVTKYKSNVVRLEDGLLPYVIACDSLTLTFRPDVPRELFPPVGGHLVTFESNEILPSGFIGTLEQLKKDGNVVAECSFPDITDVFDNLFFAMGENTQSSQPHANMNKTQWLYDDDIEVPIIKYRLPGNEWPAPSAGWGNLSGNYTNTADFNVTTEKFRARLFVLVESGEASFSFTSTGRHTLTLEASEYVNVDISNNLPVVSVNVPIYKCPLLALGLNFGLCYSLGVDGGFNFKSEIPFTSVLHFSGGIKDVGNHWESATNNIATTGRLIFGTPATSMLGEGLITAELGIYGSIDVHPMLCKGSNKLALSAGLRTGWRFSTALPDDAYASPIESANTDFYDCLNGKDVYKLERFCTRYISFENGFNGPNYEFPWDINIGSSPVWSRGVVPEFSNVSLTKTESPGTFRADATLKREIASYAKTGFALYDDSKKLVEQWWNNTIYTNQEGTRITHDFSNLKTGVNYTLHPIVTSLNQEMVANPSSDAKIVPAVITGNATDITANSVTLHGSVGELSEADDYSCGFYYGTEPYVDTMNSTFLPAIIQENGAFISKLDKLSPDTKYYYRACSNINGEMIIAEETMTFTTKVEEIEADLSGMYVWLSPVSAYFVFPNLETSVGIDVYSDPDMSNEIQSSCFIRVGCDENNGVRCSNQIWRLKPSTNYWYKVYHRPQLMTGSFTTTAGVNISTPEVIFHYNYRYIDFGQDIRDEHGNTIGRIIRTAKVEFESPMILSGVSSDLFIHDNISCIRCDHAHGGNPEKGIIYSDSPDNLTFLNPDISCPTLDYESDRFCVSEELKPGTYYYRSYYMDRSGYRLETDESGPDVYTGPDGEEIDGPWWSDEVDDKVNHLSSYYGEIKEFTIPEIVYF